MKKRFEFAPLGLLALWFLGLSVQAREQRVVVNASASDEYLELAKNKSYHTYHFVKGNYFSGQKRDNSLRKMSFSEVTKTAAKFLEGRNYFPAANKDIGDQLIMISWGNTFLDIDWNEELGITSWDFSELGADQVEPQEVTPSIGGWEYQRLGSSQTAKNIRMLGYDKGLFNKEISLIDKEQLQHDLEKDRYFFVLNVFDLPHLRKTNELKELWSCRISIRNLGTNFIEALTVMNTVAAPTFGFNLENLMVRETDSKEEIVIGEIEVLGTEEN